jgi:uncharacterized protein (TIGR03437 family)
MSGNTLPTTLPGSNVRIAVGNVYARPLYVSPTQINFIVPAGLRGGIDVPVRVHVWGLYGPEVRLRLEAAAPALFQGDPQFAVAARPDGSVITYDKPAAAGDIVTLYATGLGATLPPVLESELATRAAPLERLDDFRVELDGTVLPRESVLYAGVAPGFAGLYQINLVLPASTPHNPAIRIGFSDRVSPEGVRLPVR